MPTWTCSGPTGSYWCHQVPLVVHKYGWSQYPHIWRLGSHTKMGYALNHLVPSWQGPCTHKVGSWSHHFVDDVEDPRDGVEALVDDGEALAGLKNHQWPILWSFMLWWGHGTLGEGLETPHVVAWWILTIGGLLVWVRLSKKPMKPPAWWKSS